MEDLYYKEALEHFNEPILVGFNLCRCIGYAEDNVDCYLVVHDPYEGIFRHTFVGGYTYLNNLKGCNYCKLSSGEDCDDFTRLDSLLTLNDVPKRDKFYNEEIS